MARNGAGSLEQVPEARRQLPIPAARRASDNLVLEDNQGRLRPLITQCVCRLWNMTRKRPKSLWLRLGQIDLASLSFF